MTMQLHVVLKHVEQLELTIVVIAGVSCHLKTTYRRMTRCIG